jgi:hypothetical protein
VGESANRDNFSQDSFSRQDGLTCGVLIVVSALVLFGFTAFGVSGMTAPWWYGTDGLFHLAVTKGIMDNGWVISNPYLGMPLGQHELAAAPMSKLIKIISGAVLIPNAGFVVASFINHWAVIPAALLATITLGCYLRAPVAYEVSPSGLIILFRLGSKQFGLALRAGQVEKSMDRSIRLWGNGGLFAGTGIFWNGTWGIFRAYVTTSERANMVLVETQTGKVLVSPSDFEAFITALTRSAP